MITRSVIYGFCYSAENNFIMMKRLALLIMVVSFSLLTLDAQDGKRLTILHTNDFHSHLQGFAPESAYTPGVADNDPTVGGFSRIAGIITEVRAENPGNTLVVDGGDCLMGTLFHALEPESGFQLSLMKQAGYDVVAMGNHDFDFGPAAYAGIIRKSVQRGEIPVILMGNAITDPDDPGDDAFEAVMNDGLIKRWYVTEVDGLKIGLFSLLGKDADNSAPYAPPVTFEKIVSSGKYLVKELQQQGCDVIICLSHSGIVKDKKGRWTGEDVELAKKVKGINLIVSGHTHTLLDQPLMVNGVPIVQAGSAGMFMGRAELVVRDNSVKLETYELIKVDDNITADSLIQMAIIEQEKAIDSIILKPLGMEYSQPVAVTTFPLDVDEYGDIAGSNMGAMVADAIYCYFNNDGPGADIALVAAGVIRDALMPGAQCVPDIFRVMSLGSGNDKVPGYSLSKVWVTGRELKNIARILIFLSSSTPSNFCYYSHLNIEYDPDRLFGKVRKIELTDQEGKVTEVNTSKKDKRLYSIVANSYMLDNLGLIKKKTFGLVSLVPKDVSGNPITDMDNAVSDFNPAMPGIQEGKEWLALVRFIRQFSPESEGGLPAIPEMYRDPARSLVPVNSRK